MIEKIPLKDLAIELWDVIFRFPLTVFFILVMTGRQLYVDEIFLYDSSITSVLIVGIFVSAVGQMIYERFYKDQHKIKWVVYGGSLLLIGLYILYMRASLSMIDTEGWFFYSIPGIRAMILYFTLSILFIWIPTIKHKRIKFSDSFIVNFKALFTSQFFSIILFLGVAAIIALIQSLIYPLGAEWWSNSLIIIFNLVGPLIFLALIPYYQQINSMDEKKAESVQQTLNTSKFLDRLVSYIFIPIMGIFTAILILYIILNLNTEFFTESAIEGLLLNYTIYGWILLLLADSIKSDIVQSFKKIFPFALIFVVILQMIATFIQIKQVGITHGRYSILLFGVASVISGVWYIVKKQDLRILPFLAVVIGVISLVPPFDAMRVSINAQVAQINNTLEKNGIDMEEGSIELDSSISTREQDKIDSAINYLDGIQALNQISWLPEQYYDHPEDYLDLQTSDDLHPDMDEREEEYEYESYDNQSSVYLKTDQLAIDLGEFSQLLELTEYDGDGDSGTEGSFELNSKPYTFEFLLNDGFEITIDSDELENPLTFDFSYVLEEYEGEGHLELDTEDLTYTEENEDYVLQIIIKNLEIDSDSIYINFYLLI